MVFVFGTASAQCKSKKPSHIGQIRHKLTQRKYSVMIKYLSLPLLILSVIGCHHNQAKDSDSSGRVLLSPSNKNVDTASSSHLTQEFDSVSAKYGQTAEGIVPDFSPYYYDPTWTILYSENGRVLLYFPRDSAATHFVIPSEVQAIGDNAFMCNQHLTELTLHDNIRKISVCSFHACAELMSVTIQGPLTEIPWRAFDGCPKLETVDLPATIESIAGFAFAGCTKLRKLIVRSPDPPVFQMDYSEPSVTDFDWAFNDIRLTKCILYVPAASISKYQKAIGWNRFKHIQAI